MTYSLNLLRDAKKDIRSLPKDVIKRVASHLDELVTNPRPHGSLKMTDYENRYRIRVGDYRILYSIDDTNKIVEVKRILHRSEAYE